jgi:hypothetical protein
VKVYAEPSPPLHVKAIFWTPEDTRTAQSMPHRRSSDVASAVWLISEKAMSRTFISPSVMALTRPSVLARLQVSATSARIACPETAERASQDDKKTDLLNRFHRSTPEDGLFYANECGYQSMRPAVVSHLELSALLYNEATTPHIRANCYCDLD